GTRGGGESRAVGDDANDSNGSVQPIEKPTDMRDLTVDGMFPRAIGYCNHFAGELNDGDMSFLPLTLASLCFRLSNQINNPDAYARWRSTASRGLVTQPPPNIMELKLCSAQITGLMLWVHFAHQLD
ncbi:hypothetical protein MMC21_006225, partial [Puttea exsequens]|nr:hypothetical protein [Puttea exsequens]